MKKTKEPGLTTEENEELELDEQPKPTWHHFGHLSFPMLYNGEPVEIIREKTRGKQIKNARLNKQDLTNLLQTSKNLHSWKKEWSIIIHMFQNSNRKCSNLKKKLTD